MRNQIHRELHLFMERKSLVILWAILAAAGGTLMWVNGSIAPWVFRACQMPAGTPGFTIFFLMWLILYALHGAEWGIVFLFYGREERRGLAGWLTGFFSYLMALAWYPLFFSLLHGFLASVVLLVSGVLHTAAFLHNCRRSCVLWPVYFFTSLLEIYFLYVTIAFSWVK